MGNNERQNNQSFIVTHPLDATGPAEQLFIAGVSVFEITIFTPPVQRVTILGINLPAPGTFGPYDTYVAYLTIPDSIEPLATLPLIPTEDNLNWVATTLLDFGGTLPSINVSVRPQLGFDRIGDIILQGQVFP
ncbi:MAG: hypothetical protein APF76_00805 [Desulfitibacter sp. BRH_c19]|nr:MAG: hypothetical protein APF76_00805 [Desulfitibacter sp. BRH_c19]